MSVTEVEKVDFIGIDNESKIITLAITDHLTWEDEFEHLTMLQDKLNNYIEYILNDGPAQQFKGKEYSNEYTVIEVLFIADITDNCLNLLNHFNDAVAEYNIKITWKTFA